MPISPIAMTTTLHLPDVGSYVEMTSSDEQANRVHVILAEGRTLTVSAPLVAVPAVGAAIILRWSAAPRGRYALTCSVLAVDENRLHVEAQGEPLVEQQRHYVRGRRNECAGRKGNIRLRTSRHHCRRSVSRRQSRQESDPRHACA